MMDHLFPRRSLPPIALWLPQKEENQMESLLTALGHSLTIGHQCLQAVGRRRRCRLSIPSTVCVCVFVLEWVTAAVVLKQFHVILDTRINVAADTI